MIFSSPLFLFVFLPITWLGFALLARYRWQTGMLGWIGIASLVFYTAWDPALLPLLLGSIAANYLVAGRLDGPRANLWAWTGILFNLGLLGWFKYALFAVSITGFETQGLSTLALPLGISFFTFQQIAFLVDVKRGVTRRGSPGCYGAFVSFFPQLVAGPIVHHRELAPQLVALGFPSSRQLTAGLLMLCIGLAKKLLLADNLAPGVDHLYELNPAQLVAGDALMAGWSYGLQLYFDFSGYADMAVGLGLLFGIRLPYNFDSPYKARTLQDFWRRWHMTLSAFLRDYLYIPLGGSRHGLPRHLIALFTTMLLGGLWHGAGWQFLLWGAMHGAALCLMLLWHRVSTFRLPGRIAQGLTILLVMLAWIPFRAANIDQAWQFYQALGIPAWGALTQLSQTLSSGIMAPTTPGFTVLLASLVAMVAPNSRQLLESFQRLNAPLWQGVAVGILSFFALRALASQPTQAFLYFNF